MIGLAFRAGKCVVGETKIVKEIQQNRAKLVLLASDIGPQTKKKLTDKCKSYQIAYQIVDDRNKLGGAIGKSQRVAVAITDEGFATKIQSLLM